MTKSWVMSLLPLTLFAGLITLDSQVSILFLGFLGPNEEVGLLRVAVTGASLVSFGLNVVNMVLAPQIVRLYNAGEIEKLQRMIRLSTRMVAVISFPVALILMMWGEGIIGLVFGEEYIEAALALTILCFGQLVNTSAGSVALVLNMSGHDKQALYGIIVALVLNMVFSLLLIPHFGLVGAAISFSISLSAWNIVLMYMAKKYTGIKTSLV